MATNGYEAPGSPGASPRFQVQPGMHPGEKGYVVTDGPNTLGRDRTVVFTTHSMGDAHETAQRLNLVEALEQLQAGSIIESVEPMLDGTIYVTVPDGRLVVTTSTVGVYWSEVSAAAFHVRTGGQAEFHKPVSYADLLATDHVARFVRIVVTGWPDPDEDGEWVPWAAYHLEALCAALDGLT